MFMKALEKNQKQYTENGALGYKTTGSKIVDLNFGIPSYRREINKDLFLDALAEDKKLTLRWLLYLRDVREGIGERNSFRQFFNVFIKEYPTLAEKFVKQVPIEEYGRWDDLVAIAIKTKNVKVATVLLQKIVDQLTKDLENYTKGKPISLLAKWLPSANASSKKTKHDAEFMYTVMGLSPKQYRQILSKLRSYSNVIETKLSANRWCDVDYSAVPSVANLRYKDAFIRHDRERRVEFLNSLKNGEAKINAQAMFLHDIVHAYTHGDVYRQIRNEDATLEELWKAQDKVEGFKNTLVVRDGSGSMTVKVSGNTSALDVADAITLYCAENNSGEFKDKFITFSSNARLVDVGGYITLKDKLNRVHREDECSNTNIESVFDLILDTAIQSNISPQDMPKNVLIISDMELDMATYNYRTRSGLSATLFETLAHKYEEAGYKLPKLIFWNVNSRTNTIPITQNENGVVLLSGFSKNLMSMVMSNELDPYKALVTELMVPRYDVIETIFSY